MKECPHKNGQGNSKCYGKNQQDNPPNPERPERWSNGNLSLVQKENKDKKEGCYTALDTKHKSGLFQNRFHNNLILLSEFYIITEREEQSLLFPV